MPSSSLVITPSTDANIQLLPGWKNHTGGSIGGCPAKVYTMTQKAPNAIFYIAGCVTGGTGCKAGSCYADVDWYLTRPGIPANTGNLSLSYTITLDSNSINYAQAIETDTIISNGSYICNCSVQLDYSKGGQLQISNQGGGWVSTGYTPGKYTPNVAHHVQIYYKFDFVSKKYSTPSIVIDGHGYKTPTGLQNLTCKAEKWELGATVQIQQDLNSQAQNFTETITALNYNWF